MLSSQKDKADQPTLSSTEIEELRRIAREAYETDLPIVKVALENERSVRMQMGKEFKWALEDAQKYTEDKTLSVVKKQWSEKLETDLQLIRRLNAALEGFPVGVDRAISFPLSTNKVEAAILGAQELSDQLDCLYDGRVPQGYSFTTRIWDVTVLGTNSLTVYGSSKATFFATALFNLNIALKDFSKLQSLHFYDSSSRNWIDRSALAHIVPVPQEVWQKASGTNESLFDDFGYSYSDQQSPRGLLTIHCGYAFGGHRNHPRYPNGKAYGPQDCSSFMAKLTRSPVAFTTADQLCHYRLVHGGEVPEPWKQGPEIGPLSELCDPLEVRDPQRDIRPGQILCVRRGFDTDQDPEMKKGFGRGGHTALVLGFQSRGSDSQVVTLAYNRDMPNFEGFGIQAVPLEEPGKKMMFFSPKGKALTQGTDTIPITSLQNDDQSKFSTRKP